MDHQIIIDCNTGTFDFSIDYGELSLEAAHIALLAASDALGNKLNELSKKQGYETITVKIAKGRHEQA